MAGGDLLGGIFSARGLDLSPVQVRQADRQLDLQARGQNLTRDFQTRQLNEGARQFDATREDRAREARAGRVHELDLSNLQSIHRIDLAELEIAGQNALQQSQIAARKAEQESDIAFQQKKQEQLLELDYMKFNDNLNEQMRVNTANINNMIIKGDRESARLEIDKNLANLKAVLLERQTNNLPSAEESQANRTLQFEMAGLELKKTQVALGEYVNNEAVRRIMQDAEIALKQAQAQNIQAQTLATATETAHRPGQTQAGITQTVAQTEATLAQAEQTRFETEAARNKLEGQQTTAEQPIAPGEFLSPELASEGKIPVGSEEIFTKDEAVRFAEDNAAFQDSVFDNPDVLEDRMDAWNILRGLKDDQSGRAATLRQDIREFLESTDDKRLIEKSTAARTVGKILGGIAGAVGGPLGIAGGATAGSEIAEEIFEEGLTDEQETLLERIRSQADSLEVDF